MPGTDPAWSGDDGGDRHGRVGRQVQQRRRTSSRDELGAQRGDHGSVVGAEARARDPDADALRRRALLGHRPEPAVGGHTTTDEDVLDPAAGGRVDRLAGEHVADGLLERRGHVGDVDGHAVALLGLDPARDRGLEPGEREVEPVALEVAPARQPAREVDGDAVAAACGPVDVRTAREGQAEQPGDLVERLAGGVVDRRRPSARRRGSRR